MVFQFHFIRPSNWVHLCFVQNVNEGATRRGKHVAWQTAAYGTRTRGKMMRKGFVALAAAVAVLSTGCSTMPKEVTVTEGSDKAGATQMTTATSPSPSAEVLDPEPQRLDIAYVDDGVSEHTLDVFTPEGAGPFPVLVWAHGGGWRGGEKADLANTEIHMDEMKQALLDHGYAIASVNYRLAPASTFPAPTQDIAASVRYLKANAEKFGLDPERFALGGDSAGAHLSSLVAMAPNDDAVQGTLGETSTDSSVDAVVAYYGLYDLRGRIPDQKAQGCDPQRLGADSSHGQLLGADPGSKAGGKLAERASPLQHVGPDSPAMVMFAGREDCTAPFAQAERMRDELQKQSVPVELTVIDKGHADPKFFQDEEIREHMLRFLDAHVS